MAAFREFTRFLKEYRVIAISVAFIISLAALAFVQSLVNDIILPILRPVLSPESLTWEGMMLVMGPVNLRIGSFLSATLTLIMTVIILYVLIDRILRWKPKK